MLFGELIVGRTAARFWLRCASRSARQVPGTIVAGTPQKVDDYVKKTIETCKDGGGYIVDGGIGGIADGARPENVKAMSDATFKYGVYRK